MLIDARTLGADAQIEADLCVVGAGPVGLTVALELGRAGRRVCVLDAGGATGTEPVPGEVEGEPYPPLGDARRSGIAGTVALWNAELAPGRWGARLVPLDPSDFDGWPFDGAALEPFHARACELFGLGTFDPEPERWGVPVPLGEEVESAVYRFAPASVFAEDVRAELERSREVTCYVNARVLQLEEEAGRITRARVASAPGRELTVAAPAFVLALGGIENARLLLLSELARDSPVGRFYMDHPTLRARLELAPGASADALALLDLRRDGGRLALGHLRLTEELRRREGLLTSGFIVAPSQERAERTRAAVATLAHGPRTGRALARALAGADLVALAAARKASARVPALRAGARVWPSLGLLNTLGLGPVSGWSRLPRTTRRFRVFDAYQVIEQPPESERRITLGQERDEYGQPLARLHWFVTDREVESAQRSQELLGQALAAAGLGRLVTSAELAPDGDPRTLLHPTAHHHLGAARMADDPARGVVDADSRVHGLANLFATGTSAFATGGFVNPTLTAVALALRLADHLSDTLTSPS